MSYRRGELPPLLLRVSAPPISPRSAPTRGNLIGNGYDQVAPGCAGRPLPSQNGNATRSDQTETMDAHSTSLTDGRSGCTCMPSSLELGGDPTDPRNLWPEPYPRAAAVDRIENELNAAVCGGRLSLQDAQRKESELKHNQG